MKISQASVCQANNEVSFKINEAGQQISVLKIKNLNEEIIKIKQNNEDARNFASDKVKNQKSQYNIIDSKAARVY